jgi:hypothetical protein
MGEILASQRKMIQRLGTEGSAVSEETLGQLFAKQLVETERWLQTQNHMEVLTVHYQDAVRKPEDTARAVARFIGSHLAIAEMVRVVDPGLHRNIDN